MSHSWDDIISSRDRQVYAAAGYGKTQPPSPTARPAILVVDVTINFVGDKPEPILESIKRFPNSCGEEGWAAVGGISEILKAARVAHIPVYYTVGDNSGGDRPDASWAMKKSRSSGAEGNRIPDVIRPERGDTIIAKRKPSAFFGTPLMSMLNSQHVDTLLVTGCTTSGCVRATVIDAFSYCFKNLVVEECVFDRGQVPHKVNLFDMNQKYADVIPISESLLFLKRVGRHARG